MSMKAALAFLVVTLLTFLTATVQANTEVSVRIFIDTPCKYIQQILSHV